MTTLSRRRFLAASAATTGALITTPLGTRLALASPENPAEGDTVVLVFLRGGADGLQLAPPYKDSSYHDQRPTTSVKPPNQDGGALPLDSASSPNVVFPSGMDGVVGLNPGMKPIYDTLWKQGNLAVIPATGMPRTEGGSRSHFRAELLLERGTNDVRAAGTFMGRLVTAMGTTGAVAAVNKGSNVITGAKDTVTINRLSEFKVGAYPDVEPNQVHDMIGKIYEQGGSMSPVASTALTALEKTGQVQAPIARDEVGNKLHKAPWAYGLMEIAGMLNAKIGVRAAAIDFGGWDHHGNVDNIRLKSNNLAKALRSFADVTNQLEEITLIVITEFGRNLKENGGRGTDHGMGATHFVMGKGIQGGVFGDDYPVKMADNLVGGAVPILTDYRKTINEIAIRRAGVADPTPVFPTYTGSGTLGLTRA